MPTEEIVLQLPEVIVEALERTAKLKDVTIDELATEIFMELLLSGYEQDRGRPFGASKH